MTKIEKLLAYHRRHVFDEKTGGAHERAIKRLKRTKAFAAMCERNRDNANARASERLLRAYM